MQKSAKTFFFRVFALACLATMLLSLVPAWADEPSGAQQPQAAQQVQETKQTQQGTGDNASVTDRVYGDQNKQEKLEQKIAELRAKLEEAVSAGRYAEAWALLRKLRELQGREEATQKVLQLREELIAALQANDLDRAEQILLQILKLEKNRKGLYKQLGKIWRERHRVGMPEKVSVFVEGQPIKFDVEPAVIDGRTMIPLRRVANALGVPDDKVKWDPATQTVTVENNGTVVTLRVGDRTALLGNRAVTLDVPPQVVNGRTLIPLRFLGEAFGKQVEWYPEGNIVAVGQQ
ncbi:copper amine oxidase N-terminal domain-containing protein [Desulfovirgula thermocuniculi]|uniref:copper amine oxidase N-terminal domain-containing protein n=1 Tax=Desulfovirgula thermocuniculi TaxID=348842 RepID=UPI000487A7AB|nr:stalk domain-containing protein [Desulfovirgula thermocuniculi]